MDEITNPCPKNDYAISHFVPVSLFTKQINVLLQDLAKYRSRESRYNNDRIAVKCDSHLDSSTAEVPVKFQSDWKSLNPNRAASSLHEILR